MNYKELPKQKKNKVYIAIINQGWIKPEICLKLFEFSRMNIPFELKFHNDKPASHNRNQSVLDFLKTDCTHYLTIDHDIVPLKNIFELLEKNKDIIGCPALTIQKGSLNWTCYDKSDDRYVAIDIDKMKKNGIKGLMECDIVGSGCLLIKRKVLEIVKAPFMRQWNDNGLAEFGLDFMFCRKAKKAGFKIYSAIDYICEHYKENGLTKFLNNIYG